MTDQVRFDEEDVDVDTVSHEAEGSLIGGWPAILLTVAMISAAIYAFAPRPHPVVPLTQIKASELMTIALAEQDGRFLAVGELGRILYADSANGPWKEASVAKQRGSNLTSVQFVGQGVAVAVGHSGWLLRSDDNGESWQELQFLDNSSDPLLGIAGPFTGAAAGKLYAFGAFGQFLVSTDDGRSWQSQTITVKEAGEDAADAGEETAADEAAEMDDLFGGGSDDDYDPFAEFESGGMAEDFSGRHMYAMTQAADGSLFLVGERGMILRSTDGGATWKAMEEIYTGSFYGVLKLANNDILVYGMRGNAFVSSDLGKTWQASKIPLVQGLYDAALGDNGMVVVVGGSNTVLVSRDHGRSFIKTTRRGPDSFASILALGKNRWLLAGEGGVGKMSRFRSAGGAS